MASHYEKDNVRRLHCCIPQQEGCSLRRPPKVPLNTLGKPSDHMTAMESAFFSTGAILSLTTCASATIGSVSVFRLEPSVAEEWSVRLDEGPDAGALPLAPTPNWGGLDERILHSHAGRPRSIFDQMPHKREAGVNRVQL